MLRRAWRYRFLRLRRALFTSVALASYLAATVGVPIPEPLALADTAELPYPCQNHHCGCLNAEQCWAHCCCFSVDEKLAWARANGVSPPSWAEGIRTDGWNTPRLRDQTQSKVCCHCAGCCSGETADVSPSPASTGIPSGKKQSTVGWIFSMSAAGCRGLAIAWLALGGVTGPPSPASWRPDFQAGDWTLSLDLRARTLEQAPLIPPPRPIEFVTG